MNPLPDVTQVYSSIIQEEKQRHLGTTHDTIKALAMVVKKNEPTTLIVGHKQGPPCFNSSNRKPLHCSHCDKDHHTKETCWKLHGYPPKHQRHGVTQNANSKLNGK